MFVDPLDTLPCHVGGARVVDQDGAAGPQTVYCFGPVWFHPRRDRLLVDGKPISVEPTPLRLLLALIRRKDRIVTKEELLKVVWEKAALTDAPIAGAIRKLRAALGAAEDRIATVHRKGYMFRGPVEPIEVADDADLANASLAAQVRLALQRSQEDSARAGAFSDFVYEDFLGSLGIDSVGPGGTVSILELLAAHSANAPTRFAGLPVDEADLHIRIGRSVYRLSKFHDAVSEFERAIALLQPLPNSPRRDLLLTLVRLKLATSRAELGPLGEARRLLALAGPEPESHPLDPRNELGRAFAQARFKLCTRSERFAEALPHGRRLVALTDSLPDAHVAERFSARYLLASVLYRLQELEPAEEIYLSLLGQPFLGRVGKAQLARARINLSRVQLAMRKLDTVERNLVLGRDALLELLDQKEQAVAVANAELGALYEYQGDFARAAGAYGQAYEDFSVSVGQQFMPCKGTLLNLAAVRLFAGDPGGALVKLDELRPWFVESLGSADTGMVQTLDFHRASALTSLGQPEAAIGILQCIKHERIAEASPSRDWASRLRAELGRALLASGAADEGRRLLRSAIDEMKTDGAPPWVAKHYRTYLRRRPGS